MDDARIQRAPAQDLSATGKVGADEGRQLPNVHSNAMLDSLRKMAPDWRIDREPVTADTVALISGRVTREDLASAPNLESIIIPFAGVPVPLRELMVEFPHVSVHNLHHNAPETAEVAMALLLACAKSVVPIDQAMRKGDWTPGYEDSHSIRLDGKTAVVLGYGAIGQRIARACQGLGMRVIAHRRHPDAPVNGVDLRGPSDLDRSLGEADVLILAVPQTDETTNLIGSRELAMMKTGAILVNIARGKLVDEDALYEALVRGKLRAAGIDVWYRYPEGGSDGSTPESAAHTFPSTRPFHELPNVVMSPHRGGASLDVEPARIQALAELLNTHPMPNRIDLSRGY